MLRGKGLLTPLQRACLAAFAGLPDQAHFYLSGGTALAEFYLGHRLSFDLDLFTPEEALILPTSYQIETTAPRYGLQVSVVRRFATCGTGDRQGSGPGPSGPGAGFAFPP